MAGLLSRVEAASGGDRELDALLAIATKWKPLGNIEHWIHDWEHGFRLGDVEGCVYLHEAPVSDTKWAAHVYAASLDAAVALVERVLPGWGWDVTYRASWGNYTACVIANSRSAPPHTASGKTHALALCAALLRALIAQQEAGETDNSRSASK